MGFLHGKGLIQNMIRRCWGGPARTGMETETAPLGAPTPKPAPTAKAMATATVEPSQPAGPLPMSAYNQVGPDLYQHSVTGDVVMAADILTFAITHADSELHTCFEWDDGRAACLWRLQQVRELLLNELIIGPDGTADMNGVKR